MMVAAVSSTDPGATVFSATPANAPSPRPMAEGIALRVLLALSVSHFLNDVIQSLLPAIYPLLKESFHLTFAQVGLITFSFQLTASMLQPLVGFYTDRQPRPFSLAIGMGVTLVGLILLSQAASFHADEATRHRRKARKCRSGEGMISLAHGEALARPPDLEGYVRGCRFTADRVGLLCCGSPLLALQAWGLNEISLARYRHSVGTNAVGLTNPPAAPPGRASPGPAVEPQSSRSQTAVSDRESGAINAAQLPKPGLTGSQPCVPKEVPTCVAWWRSSPLSRSSSLSPSRASRPHPRWAARAGSSRTS